MRRLRTLPVAGAVLLASLAAVVLSPSPAGAALPVGFSDQSVAFVPSPTAMAFTPDGRILVTTQPGALRVIQNDVLLAAPAIDLSAQICSNSERGLLGVAVDPAFATNGFVFLYYSFKTSALCDSTTVNRVSRFVMSGNALASETVLINNIPSTAGNHNAGDLHFGNDGLLYVSVGDGGCDYPGGTPSGCAAANDASRDLNALVGKILRIDRDGNVPAGNAFSGGDTARCNITGVVATNLKCQETFAWGLRNPFRTAFDPNSATTKFHINDVGQSTWEEIDLGAAGADYGWNVREGHCATGSTITCGLPPAGMTNPIFDYGRSDGCVTITGGAFVPNGLWPSQYDDKYLFADYGCGRIFTLEPSGGGGFTRVDFAGGVGSVVDLAFGPWRGSQALYYTTYSGGGEVRRITTTTGTTPDFNGDGATDVSVFRPATGQWFAQNQPAVSFGLNSDTPTPADFDGNRTADVAVFRPSTGQWFVSGQAAVSFGLNGDLPVPGDYDGNGAADIAVFRPSVGGWYRNGAAGTFFGLSGDIPVPGDYNGDGATDIAVFRPSVGGWYVNGAATTFFGLNGDIPVPGDYNGDGTTDIAVFRPSVGGWYISGQSPAFFGLNGDIPVPGDYDGNGTTDIAVYRPSTNQWFVLGQPATTFGISGDLPLPLPSAIRQAFFP